MKNLEIEIGKRIKAKREALKLSQKSLSEKVGISPAAINQFEKGEKKPSTQVLFKIADVLETTTDTLLSGIEEKDAYVAFRGFSKLSANDKETVMNLVKILKDKNKKK